MTHLTVTKAKRLVINFLVDWHNDDGDSPYSRPPSSWGALVTDEDGCDYLLGDLVAFIAKANLK